MIDLHIHSTFSDGTFSPEQIIDLAIDKELTAIALTDHDTVEGNDRFIRYGENFDIKIIPGLEISAEYNSSDNINSAMHILGYFMNWDDTTSDSLTQLEEIRENRRIRNTKIIDRLCSLGCNITMEEVNAIANNNVVGRPHIAEILVKKGFVRNNSEAFAGYLAKGSPAYVSRKLPNPKEAIELIAESGGLPVLAHPSSLRIESEKLFRDTLEELVSYGLQGIEVSSYSSKWDDTQQYLSYAYLYDLVATAGSDFHGNTKSDITLGIKLDSEENCIEQLYHRALYRI